LKELEKNLRIKRRELRPLKIGISEETKKERLARLYARCRLREKSVIKIQKVFRGYRVRKAFSSCGGVNYWEER
jgi:hypothetical protein